MYENFKAGFVTIVGKPNVGKSTLMNKFIGEKLSIISPKPQTTRQSVKGFFTDDNCQIVFLDTPGFVEPRYELHTRMNKYLTESLKGTDIVVFMTDATKYPTDYDKQVIKLISNLKVPKIGIINKIDLMDQEIVSEKLEDLSSNNFDIVMGISALHDEGLDGLKDQLIIFLPYSPPFYDSEELTDLPMKFFAQEIIREQIFLNYQDEIPYSTAVVVEKYKDYDNKAEILANIWLERASQKPIVLGKGGAMIKKVRLNAEKEIHKLTQKRVKLELWLKIKPGWRKKKNALKEFGYS